LRKSPATQETDAEHLVQQAALRLLEEEARGEFVEEEEMDARFEQAGRPQQQRISNISTSI